MKQDIEGALRTLVGLTLWDASRAAHIAIFRFGEDQLTADGNSPIAVLGGWSIHLSCPWRLRDEAKILVASSDYYHPADHLLDSDEEFVPDVSGANQRDQRLRTFMHGKETSLVVTAVSADEVGGFQLELASRFYLEAFPASSVEDVDYWRLFRPSTDSLHFVVTASGIEDG